MIESTLCGRGLPCPNKGVLPEDQEPFLAQERCIREDDELSHKITHFQNGTTQAVPGSRYAARKSQTTINHEPLIVIKRSNQLHTFYDDTKRVLAFRFACLTRTPTLSDSSEDSQLTRQNDAIFFNGGRLMVSFSRSPHHPQFPRLLLVPSLEHGAS